MRRVASGFSPPIVIDPTSGKSLHSQIYDAYRTAILKHKLQPGQQVPSTRVLALELGISRIPVLNAYAQLQAEGYFESPTRGGTFICRRLPEQLTGCEPPHLRRNSIGSGERNVSRRSALMPSFHLAPWIQERGAFCVGQVAADTFPSKVWSSLVTRHCRDMSTRSLNFSSPMGLERFRKVIAEYVRAVRGVNCDERQILVVSGSQQALELSAHVLLDAGDSVWFEEPGYWLARRAFALAGCQIVPVPVDNEGLEINAGIRQCREARLAYVTPSHQFPLGTTMSVARRMQLLDWAQSSGSWIIEDDYDSEYRYEGTLIPSLQGLDANSRVIYVGTFSKILFPSLRVGYLVVPPDLVDRFVATRIAMDMYPPQLYQAVLADFIGDGHLARHTRRMRLIYGEKLNLVPVWKYSVKKPACT